MKAYNTLLMTFVLATLLICSLNFLNKKSDKRGLRFEEEQPIEVFYLHELFKSTITNESLDLNDPLVYRGNAVNDTFSLFDIVNDKCLVFRFSGEACNTCIDFVIEQLKKTFPDYASNERILLIGSNINNRVKEKYYGKPVISYVLEDLGLPFEEYNIPFLMIIDRDRESKMMFIPEKSMPDLTEMYFKAVKERYFERG